MGGNIVLDEDAFIVDGQTRVLGADHAAEKDGTLKEFAVPYVLLDDVDKHLEMTQFKIVNGEAKYVRTDLVNMILTELAKEKGEDTLRKSERWRVAAAKTVEILNTDELGPWFDMIVLPNASAYGKEEVAANQGLRHKRLARATSFMTSIKPVYDWLSEIVFRSDDLTTQASELASILTEYWVAIKDLMPEAFLESNDYVLQKTPGIFSLHMLLAKPVMRDMHRGRRSFTAGDFRVMLEPIPEMSNASYWRTSEHGASAYGSMRGFADLAEILRMSL
jgi:hypothetical protein